MGRTEDPWGPRFDLPVSPGGYAWWYFDGVELGGQRTITVIAFVGAAFSPAYFRARRQQLFVDPAQYCAMNVVVHDHQRSSWSLSEYRGPSVVRTAHRFSIGDNHIERGPGGVDISIDDRTTPWGRPLRGRLALRPHRWADQTIALDPLGRHNWRPIAPCAQMEVELENPRVRFVARGYHDSNWGSEPLEHAFSGWNWLRVGNDHRTDVVYDLRDRQLGDRRIGLSFWRDGHVAPLDGLGHRALPRSGWGLQRSTRRHLDEQTTLVRSLVDAPFYARALTAHRRDGDDDLGIHEVIDLDRFSRVSTQLMLPFRTRTAVPRW